MTGAAVNNTNLQVSEISQATAPAPDDTKLSTISLPSIANLIGEEISQKFIDASNSFSWAILQKEIDGKLRTIVVLGESHFISEKEREQSKGPLGQYEAH